MERNYFVVSVGEPGKNYDTENLTRCILNNCFVLNRDTIQKGSIEEIKEDDLLILKYKDHFVGYGRAKSILLTDKDLSEGELWNQRIDMHSWVIGNHIHKYGIQGATETGSGQFATVKKVNRDFALQKIEEIGFTF